MVVNKKIVLLLICSLVIGALLSILFFAILNNDTDPKRKNFVINIPSSELYNLCYISDKKINVVEGTNSLGVVGNQVVSFTLSKNSNHVYYENVKILANEANVDFDYQNNNEEIVFSITVKDYDINISVVGVKKQTVNINFVDFSDSLNLMVGKYYIPSDYTEYKHGYSEKLVVKISPKHEGVVVPDVIYYQNGKEILSDNNFEILEARKNSNNDVVVENDGSKIFEITSVESDIIITFSQNLEDDFLKTYYYDYEESVFYDIFLTNYLGEKIGVNHFKYGDKVYFKILFNEFMGVTPYADENNFMINANGKSIEINDNNVFEILKADKDLYFTVSGIVVDESEVVLNLVEFTYTVESEYDFIVAFEYNDGLVSAYANGKFYMPTNIEKIFIYSSGGAINLNDLVVNFSDEVEVDGDYEKEVIVGVNGEIGSVYKITINGKFDITIKY